MDVNLSKPVAQEALPALSPARCSAAGRGAPPPSSQPDSLPIQSELPAALESSAAAPPEPTLSPSAVFMPAEAVVSADAFALTGETAPVRSADNQGEACDRAVLDELRAEGGTLLADLAGIFQVEVAAALSQLACALEARDCAAAARIAHTLKGSAGIFGAARMQELAAQIDHAARAGWSDQAAEMFGELYDECERVRRCVAAAITA
jgi:HPt (histidine-containing phosphotransfer) domain-containing protein